MRTIKPADTFDKSLSPVNRADTEMLSKKLQLFETHFQKIYRRHNLFFNKKKGVISCTNFPFSWTNFEYNGSIKISFFVPLNPDYKKFRKESISEFNSLFKNHKASWSYPYDNIRIFGDEAFNGIGADDMKSQIIYVMWLIAEVTKFLQKKEDVLLNTPLYRSASSGLRDQDFFHQRKH